MQSLSIANLTCVCSRTSPSQTQPKLSWVCGILTKRGVSALATEIACDASQQILTLHSASNVANGVRLVCVLRTLEIVLRNLQCPLKTGALYNGNRSGPAGGIPTPPRGLDNGCSVQFVSGPTLAWRVTRNTWPRRSGSDLHSDRTSTVDPELDPGGAWPLGMGGGGAPTPKKN